jgi:hypothetical protein
LIIECNGLFDTHDSWLHVTDYCHESQSLTAVEVLLPLASWTVPVRQLQLLSTDSRTNSQLLVIGAPAQYIGPARTLQRILISWYFAGRCLTSVVYVTLSGTWGSHTLRLFLICFIVMFQPSRGLLLLHGNFLFSFSTSKIETCSSKMTVGFHRTARYYMSTFDWVLNVCWASPAEWFLVPRGFMTLFYYLMTLGNFIVYVLYAWTRHLLIKIRSMFKARKQAYIAFYQWCSHLRHWLTKMHIRPNNRWSLPAGLLVRYGTKVRNNSICFSISWAGPVMSVVYIIN